MGIGDEGECNIPEIRSDRAKSPAEWAQGTLKVLTENLMARTQTEGWQLAQENAGERQEEAGSQRTL